MPFKKLPENKQPNQTSQPGQPPQSIQQTKVWRQSQAGLKQLWSNYLNVLSTSFHKMTRAQQELVIGRYCLVITLGVTGLLLSLFYSFIPQPIKMLSVPVLGIAAWWAGNNLVSPAVIARFSRHLNRDV